MSYQGYLECKRCGDRWPVMFVQNQRSPITGEWDVHPDFIDEATHAKMHDTLIGRIRLWMDRMARRFGVTNATW